MAAAAAQQRSRLGQAIQAADVGAGGRLRRAVLHRNATLQPTVAYVCVMKKVRMFGYCCTRVQWAYVVFRARLGRPKRCFARWYARIRADVKLKMPVRGPTFVFCVLVTIFSVASPV